MISIPVLVRVQLGGGIHGIAGVFCVPSPYVGSLAVDPRLLFVAEMLLAPIAIAMVLLALVGVIHFVAHERPQR